MEEQITFVSDGLQLEGLFKQGSSARGVVITHPHPLYGGDMLNPVVESVATRFARSGYATLRFNFRGVQQSEGQYEDGVGEQADVLAAINYLRTHGVTTVTLVGYSFGSWVLGKIKEFPSEVDCLIFISPPEALMPFDPGLQFPLLKLVITGEEDEIAPVELVRASLSTWNPEATFKVVDFADHFYFGYFVELEKLLADYISTTGSLST